MFSLKSSVLLSDIHPAYLQIINHFANFPFRALHKLWFLLIFPFASINNDLFVFRSEDDIKLSLSCKLTILLLESCLLYHPKESKSIREGTHLSRFIIPMCTGPLNKNNIYSVLRGTLYKHWLTIQKKRKRSKWPGPCISIN